MNIFSKSVSALASCALLLFVFVPAPISQAQTTAWEEVGSPGFSDDAAYWQSLAFDSAGTAYVGFQENFGASVFKPVVRQWDGTTWQTIGTPGFSTGSVNAPFLALAPDNTPYVVYRDDAQAGKATVKKFNGTTWETVGTEGFSAGNANHPRLTFDASGAPYVVYADSSLSLDLIVKAWNGTAWETVGPEGIMNGNFPRIVTDSNGDIYISSEEEAQIRKWDGTTWSSIVSPFSTPGTVTFLDLAFDSANVPHVAYRDGTQSFRLAVKKWDGTAWVSVGAAAVSPGDAQYISLVFDATDTPYVTYRDETNGGKATLKTFPGTDWQTVGTDGFSEGGAFYLALALSPGGVPYVGYSDGAYGDRTTVQRFSDEPAPGGDIEAKVNIQEGEVTIGAPSLIQFPDTGVSDAEQTVDVTVTDHFFVKDLKAAAAGYFTTLSVSDMVDDTKTIAADNMEIRVENGTVEALEGTTDPNVTVPTATQTYTQFTSSSPITLLQRSADSDGLVGKYGVLPDFQLTIPAYQSLGSYTATMTYTLIEN